MLNMEERKKPLSREENKDSSLTDSSLIDRSSTKSYFSVLPKSLIAQLYTYLSLSERMRLVNTNREMCKINKSIALNLIGRRLTFDCFTQIKNITWNGLNLELSENSSLNLLQSTLPSLSKLALFKYRKDYEEDIFVNLESLFTPNIKCISLKQLIIRLNLKDLNFISICVNLRHLALNNCTVLSNVVALQMCCNLESLDIGYCNSLVTLEEIKNLPRLNKIEIKFCDNLTVIPGFENCPSLDYIEVFSCSKVSKVSNLANITDKVSANILTTSTITDTTLSKTIVTTPIKLLSTPTNTPSTVKLLTTVNIISCAALKDISGLENCSIKNLDLSNNSTLHTITAIASCTQLEELILDDYQSLNYEDPFQNDIILNCRALRLLSLNSVNISTLNGFEVFTSLKKLYLSDTHLLEDISSLSKCTNLEVLYLPSCTMLRDITAIGCCPLLTELDLSQCINVDNIIPLSKCINLTELNLAKCTGINNLELNNINLTKLIYSRGGITHLSGLRNCINLTNLYFSECPLLIDISVIRYMPNLNVIHIEKCPLLDNIDSISFCVNLVSLSLTCCTNLEDISHLVNCTKLKTLFLNWCTNLKNILALETCNLIESLFLSNTAVDNLSVVAYMPKLISLDISQTPIKCINSLSVAKQLKILLMSDCNLICDLSVLLNLSNLEKLTADGCSDIVDCTPILSCTKLRSLNLSRCPKILNISDLCSNEAFSHLRKYIDWRKDTLPIIIFDIYDLGEEQCFL
jgi:hypothetical protein